jgi:nucleotide-binding universal stress UspA family protein
MAFKHIVVPYEGGPLCEDALLTACDLAGDGARITAVYVVRVSKSMPVDVEQAQTETGEEFLLRAGAIARDAGADIVTYVAKAPEVADGVNESAATLRADAIVMSLRHRHTPEETMVLSHTASRILRHAPCPVLILYRRREEA